MSVEEEWRPWRDGTYEVSSCGRVRRGKPGRHGSHRSPIGKMISVCRSSSGYMIFGDYTNGSHVNIMVHRAVAECFLPAPVGDQIEVNHIDGDKSNNRLSNLEWVSKSENMKHALRTGLHGMPLNRASGDDHWTRKNPDRVKRGDENGARLHPELIKRGEDAPAHKLHENDIVEIRSLYASGDGLSSLGRKYNVSHKTIERIVKRLSWRHVP